MNDKRMIKITMDNLRKDFDQSKVILEPNKGKRKYSEIFHNYMAPVIEETIDDEESLNEVLNWGQIIWNYAVAMEFPNHPKSKNILALFPFLKLIIVDDDFISDFINRKREMFGADLFFIIQQESLLSSGGRLAISVVVELLEDSR